MKYYWIGHCREGTSDKIWGLIHFNSDVGYGFSTRNYVAFWGRRGKKLQTKIYNDLSNWDAIKLCNKKEDRGYKVIDLTRLDDVYPEFEEDLQKTTVWALLSV